MESWKVQKKKIGIIMLVLSILVANNLPPMSQYTGSSIIAEAASKSKKAKLAYKKYLSSSEQYWGNSYYNTSYFKFVIKDLNGDGVPEMIVGNKYANMVDSNFRIFTYYNGKIVELTDVYSGKIDKIYPKKNLIVISGSKQGEYWTYYYKIVNYALQTIATVKGYDYLEGHEGKIVYSYYVKDNKTTKAKFNQYIKKIKGSAKASSYKLRANTASNRSKYLK